MDGTKWTGQLLKINFQGKSCGIVKVNGSIQCKSYCSTGMIDIIDLYATLQFKSLIYRIIKRFVFVKDDFSFFPDPFAENFLNWLLIPSTTQKPGTTKSTTTKPTTTKTMTTKPTTTKPTTTKPTTTKPTRTKPTTIKPTTINSTRKTTQTPRSTRTQEQKTTKTKPVASTVGLCSTSLPVWVVVVLLSLVIIAVALCVIIFCLCRGR